MASVARTKAKQKSWVLAVLDMGAWKSPAIHDLLRPLSTRLIICSDPSPEEIVAAQVAGRALGAPVFVHPKGLDPGDWATSADAVQAAVDGARLPDPVPETLPRRVADRLTRSGCKKSQRHLGAV